MFCELEAEYKLKNIATRIYKFFTAAIKIMLFKIVTSVHQYSIIVSAQRLTGVR